MARNMASALLLVYALSAPLQAAAQDSSAPSTAIAQVRFEVAFIHPSRPSASARDARVSSGADRFDAEAATIGDILDMLNGWQLGRVVGGPEWMRTERYSIHATAGAPIPPGERK